MLNQHTQTIPTHIPHILKGEFPPQLFSINKNLRSFIHAFVTRDYYHYYNNDDDPRETASTTIFIIHQ